MTNLNAHDPQVPWQFCGHTMNRGSIPRLMGIVNVTPDSFSDGGQYNEAPNAVEHALKLVDDGADIIDVGGESTRPGSSPVDADEQIRRVVPVIKQLSSQVSVPISIDTTNSQVARQAIDAGATIVNDISGLRFDERMPELCAKAGVGVVCMHIVGTPATMQNDPHYNDVVAEIVDYFRERLTALEQAGIPQERIVLDPGVGFGKTAEHNLEILSHIGTFRELGCPVLIGHSRKRFLSKVLGRPVEERTMGTVGVAVALAMQSTDIIRVHDVQATRDALLAWHAVTSRI